MAWICALVRGIHTATGKNENAARFERSANLLQHASLPRKRNVPDAVPSGDEIIAAWKLPDANIGQVERDAGMFDARQPEHFCGNIEPFGGEPVREQKVNDPAAAAAADVQRVAARRQKLKSSRVLGDAVRDWKGRGCPVLRDPVVMSCDLLWFHLVTGLGRLGICAGA